jgi:hypothetical protein
MAAGMDVSSLITKQITLDDVEANLQMLNTNPTEVKVTLRP